MEARNTRKSRLVDEMASAIIDLVLEGDRAPSKTQVVVRVVDDSLSDGASSGIRAMLEDETANMLERYWAEVCNKAAEAIDGSAFHYTSQKYYKRKRKVPENMEEAESFVVCFGNGRRGKAAGVRFPGADDEPDAMLLVATKKGIDVVNAAFETHRKRMVNMCMSPALPDGSRAELLEGAVKRIS